MACTHPRHAAEHASRASHTTAHMSGSDGDAKVLRALFKANRALTEVDLSHNSVGAAAIAALASVGSPEMVMLNLSHNGLRGVEAGEALRQVVLSMPKLNQLQVGMNRLGDEGGVKLAEAVRGGSITLSKLSVPSNGLGDQAAYAFGAALGSNRSMSSLALWGNPGITASAKAALNSAWGERRGVLSLGE